MCVSHFTAPTLLGKTFIFKNTLMTRMATIMRFLLLVLSSLSFALFQQQTVVETYIANHLVSYLSIYLHFSITHYNLASFLTNRYLSSCFVSSLLIKASIQLADEHYPETHSHTSIDILCLESYSKMGRSSLFMLAAITVSTHFSILQ